MDSRFLPHSHFGAINEALADSIENYDGCKGKKDKRAFENMMKQKAMTALCDSGEAVGLLAAQVTLDIIFFFFSFTLTVTYIFFSL